MRERYVKRCEKCKATEALESIYRAALACDSANGLNYLWVRRECEDGLKIPKATGPRKFS